ncbi:DUF4331 family protein [Flavobacterium capsici]|uniref:DUF4331 family protein n=1 Tax=Flavobacterium capsici TaxID=3075618 RepID=A0AA96EW55_9FLAO|nr:MULTISPECIES: DUF4331 family protein [unclassified Flavobacterium]WNM18218.1 DUF4331 family protein [Flavobacterium sp. PMR2A8]WNM22269.1 DUF4331 family protein [Flavobacterium sp. PMTSA4]
MKNNNIYSIITICFCMLTLFVGCSKDESTDSELLGKQSNGKNFFGTYMQEDQMARPAINTVFVGSGAPKDLFNTTIPSQMGANFQSSFQTRLLALNPGYTANALGLDAFTFTSVLATDVLNVSKTAPTTFFDGTNVLTGRNLSDDVIDVELLLIFGGPDGTANAAVTSDHVDSNDKPFTESFPYLATPW